MPNDETGNLTDMMTRQSDLTALRIVGKIESSTKKVLNATNGDYIIQTLRQFTNEKVDIITNSILALELGKRNSSFRSVN